MQVTVIGAGAMGCLFGASLQRGGHTVTLVDTRADAVHTLQRRGVTVEEPGGGRETRASRRHPRRRYRARRRPLSCFCENA